jgi:Dolichyl-phosphate-mannose-protein mannosyltransferase
MHTADSRVHFSRSFASIALLALTFIAYMGNGRRLGAADTLPTRYLPIGLLRHFTFYLDGFPALYNADAMKNFSYGESKPYYLTYCGSHYVSMYTPGPALLALPVYAVPVLAGMPDDSPWLPQLEKLSASVITAFSVLFLFWALRQVVSEIWALAIAVVYAFGTSSFSTSSQALWQHGPSQFFLALALYFLVKGIQTERYLAYAGFALGAAVVMRPTDALLAFPIGLWIIHEHRKVLLKFVLFALPPLILIEIYNHVYLRSVVGFHVASDPVAWKMPMLKGLTGLLFSPGRGLFIYSPIFLLSLWGMYLGWRSGDWFLRYLSLGPVLVVLLYSKWFMWWGGGCYGPRMLADITPILCFFLYPVCQQIKGRHVLIGAFIVLALFSIGLHTLGVYWNDGEWDAIQDINNHPERLWSWRNSPIVYCGKTAYWGAGAIYHDLFDRWRSSAPKSHSDARTHGRTIFPALKGQLEVGVKPALDPCPWCSLDQAHLGGLLLGARGQSRY